MIYTLAFNTEENVFKITIGPHTMVLEGAETMDDAEFMANYIEDKIMNWETQGLDTGH